MIRMDADRASLLDDDFVFEPNAWDLASAIGIRVEPEDDRPELAQLADAMLVWMDDGPELERLTSGAMSELWTDDLESMIRDGLLGLRRKGGWRRAAEQALAELDRDPKAAEVSREVVRHLALELAHNDTPLLFCLHCLEEHIGKAPPGERRAIALQAAIVARRDAAVPRNRLQPYVATRGRRDELGTTARRRAVRRRLARIADFGRASMPTLAAELAAIAEEPLPGDPAADDVWQAVLTHLLAEVAMPELN